MNATQSTIAKEIKQVSGFADLEELRAAMPENPDATPSATGIAPQPGSKKRGPRRPPQPKVPALPPDPFLNDKRYQEACGRMAAFGGKGMITRGFDAGAYALDDPKFKLDERENLIWDDFFYVLSKKPMFDVGNPVYLAVFFVVTLLAQLGWRVIERSESTFIKDLFARKPQAENPPETEEVA